MNEGECYYVNNENWISPRKFFIKKVFKNGNVSFKSVSRRFYDLKINKKDMNEYSFEKCSFDNK